MNKRSKISLNIACLIAFLGLLMIVPFSGCMESKVSAANEINTSFSLVNSAELRLKNVLSDLNTGAYTGAKTELKASRVDFEEALKVLNNSSSDYEEENKAIERFKTFAGVGLDRVSSLENITIAMEHLEKSVAYLGSNDLNLSKKELDKTNEALNNSTFYLNSAKDKISSIDPASVPVVQKSYVTALRSDLENSEKISSEVKEMINSMYPFIDGYENLFNSVEYMKAEEWNKAADECANSSTKFSESKKSLEKLKNSEYSEISVWAIKIYGILEKVEGDLPHLEAACRYMDQGSYSQAEEEINKISGYYE